MVEKKDTKCWTCANAVPNPATRRGCEWSVLGEPVPDWTADWDEKKLTWCVRECPKFVPDSEVTDAERYQVDDRGCKELAGAILKTAGTDYHGALKRGKKLKGVLNEKKAKNLKMKLKLREFGRKREWVPDWSVKNTEDDVDRNESEVHVLERFFKSQFAEGLMPEGNPVYVMEQIRKAVKSG